MSERPTVTIAAYAQLAEALDVLVRGAPDLPVWSLHPWPDGDGLTVDVLACTREAVAAWAGLLGGHTEHVAEVTGRLHCEASGLVAGVSVRVLAIVDADTLMVGTDCADPHGADVVLTAGAGDARACEVAA